MHRGERLIKLGNSWFSAKSIDVKPFVIVLWCRALNGCGGYFTLLNSRKLRKHSIKEKNLDTKESVPGCEGPGTKGKQPRSLAKVLKKKAKRERGLLCWNSQKVGLEAAILERKRNSSMV